jgi:hypothetical protein
VLRNVLLLKTEVIRTWLVHRRGWQSQREKAIQVLARIVLPVKNHSPVLRGVRRRHLARNLDIPVTADRYDCETEIFPVDWPKPCLTTRWERRDKRIDGDNFHLRHIALLFDDLLTRGKT